MLGSSLQFNAVKGLIPGLAETGKIKIGRLGEERKSQSGGTYRLPEKLSYFLVTTRIKDAKENWFLDEEVHRAIGPQPTEIPVALMYDDPVLNCQSRLNCYEGSRRWCHGNNEQALRMDAQGIYRERECPCPLFTSPELAEENTGRPANKLLKCKFYGVLRVQITCKTSSVGCYGFRTTSSESFSNVLGMMATVIVRTGGILAGIPLRLRLYGSTDNTPGGASKSYKVYLDLPAGGWDEVDAAAERIVRARSASRLNLKAIEADARKKLLALTDGTSEADAIIDELFPRPVTVVNGVEVLTEDEVIDGDVADLTPAEPQAAAPGGNGAPVQAPEPAAERFDGLTATSTVGWPTPTPAEPPPPPDAALLFDEAFKQEAAAGAKEVKAQAIADQVKALEVLITLSGYDPHNLKKPLGQFSRGERQGFFFMLTKRIAEKRAKEAAEQTALPWEK